ncbi:MAG: hypothetical protein LBU00_03610, partial [Treponema sp.]|nr:hypothetical protein [Treponema sp.]
MLNYTQGARELAEYYAAPGPDLEKTMEKIHRYCDDHGDSPACTRKAFIHEVMTAECPVKVFPHVPFFWEFAVGRDRCDWGLGSPLAGYIKNKANGQWLEAYQRDVKKYVDACLLRGWSPVGYDHHCPGYDNIFKKGLSGFIADARGRLSPALRADERDFLEALIRSNTALVGLAHRFAVEAERLLASVSDKDGRSNLQRIAAAARRVPEYPPETFFEAIATILFIRESYGSLETFGQSTFGHLDRLLFPYYQRDCAEGRINREEAAKLIHALLAFTDAKFGINDAFYRETSTTLVIGGCDEQGTPVFNDITRMIVEACMENRYIGTKIIARISGRSPEEYVALLARFTASCANICVMPNDDVLIPANRRWNKSLGDSRLYVGGGCHEIVLANTEVRTRADTWVNLPALFLQTLGLDGGHEFPELKQDAGAPDFESFYAACLDNVQRFHNIIAGLKETYERRWNSFDAAPLYSASISDCIENARDVTSGGARYNSVSLSMVGAATFIDSLAALKLLVFDEKQVSLAELRKVLADNWEGAESLRLYIVNRLPTYGSGNPGADDFASRVLRDLAKTAGQPNGRGGIVTPSFYAHDTFMGFGRGLMATPDGRKKGDYLSRGISPSEFIPVKSVTDTIGSLQRYDLSLYP